MKIKKHKQQSKIKSKKRVIDYSTYVDYNTYKKKKIKKEFQIKGRQNFIDFAKTFFEVIAENIVEREAGVFYKDLGYFFVWKCPRKMSYRVARKGKELKEKYNIHTDNYMYFLQYSPTRTHKALKYFSMDTTFNDNIKKGISTKLKNGYRYKQYSSTLYKLLN